MHTYNRIGKYLRMYVVDDVMLMGKLALLDMDFQWHASIHCTMNSLGSVVVVNLHYIESIASQYSIAVKHHVDSYTLVALLHRPLF